MRTNLFQGLLSLILELLQSFVLAQLPCLHLVKEREETLLRSAALHITLRDLRVRFEGGSKVIRILIYLVLELDLAQGIKLHLLVLHHFLVSLVKWLDGFGTVTFHLLTQDFLRFFTGSHLRTVLIEKPLTFLDSLHFAILHSE